MREGVPVRLADVLRSTEPPRPTEAVAIVIELCRQVMSRREALAVTPAISISTVGIDGSGAVAVEGGVPVEDEQTVFLLGRLLKDLLSRAGGGGADVVPARVNVVAARAASQGRSAYASVAHLLAALHRAAPGARGAVIRELFERWQAAQQRQRALYAARIIGAEPVPEPANPGWTDRRAAGAWHRRPSTRLIVAAALLLLLVSVGIAVLRNASPGELPIVVPPARSTPAAPPARERGWELLQRPSRVSTEQPAARQTASAKPGPQLTTAPSHSVSEAGATHPSAQPRPAPDSGR